MHCTPYVRLVFYLCIHTCMYMYTYICVCVYIYIVFLVQNTYSILPMKSDQVENIKTVDLIGFIKLIKIEIVII